MSIRNYNAWLRAARKAASKTGGLSLPAARKAYRKMAAHIGRPLKGTDVKKHPIIFKRSIPAKAGGIKPRPAGLREASNRKRAVSGKAAKPARITRPRKSAEPIQRPREGPPRTAGPAGGLQFTEYVSTPEYTKRGAKGGFHLQLQIHLRGPAGLDKKQLDAIASDWLQGKGLPSGFTASKLEWNNKETKDPRVMRVARSHFGRIPFDF